MYKKGWNKQGKSLFFSDNNIANASTRLLSKYFFDIRSSTSLLDIIILPKDKIISILKIKNIRTKYIVKAE